MKCDICERRWQNGENRKGCQVLLAKEKDCWAFTTDKDWEAKVNEAVNAYSLKKMGHSFQSRGTEMGFNELFEAIWKRAVDDEIELARRRLRAKGFKVAYRIYQLKGGELPPNDKRFIPFKKDISDYIYLTIEDLAYRIRQLIFEESKEWPYNKNIIQQDKEYQELYQELEIEVIEFSKERMFNRWNKI